MRADKYRPLVNGVAKNPTRLIRRLKTEDSEVISTVLSWASEDFKRQLFGAPVLSRSYETLLFPAPLSSGKSARDESRWLVLSLLECSSLPEQLSEIRRFTQLILLGDLPEARTLLTTYTANYGVSIWSISAELNVVQLSHGLGANREKLNEIQAKLPFLELKLLAEFSSQRAESTTAYSSYLDDIQRTIGVLAERREWAEVVNWWRFGAAPFEDRQQDLEADLLWRYILLPPVDRYHALVRILQSTSNSNLISDPQLRPLILRLADRVFDIDPQLRWIYVNLDPTRFWKQTSASTLHLNGLVDAYTDGNYEHVITHGSSLLKSCPDTLELYELIVFSHVYSRKQMPTSAHKPSLSEEILQCMHGIASRSRVSEHVQHLLRIATMLSHSRFGAQIWGFVSEQPVGTNSASTRISALSASEITPRFAASLKGGASDFILSKLEQEGFSGTNRSQTTTSLFRAMRYADNTAIPHNIPQSRQLKYAALGQLAAGQFALAQSSFTRLRLASADIPPLYETAVRGLYDSLKALGRDLETATLVVDLYLENQTLLQGLDLEAFGASASMAPPNIIWPIFWAILHRIDPAQDHREQTFDCLDDFLSSVGATFPSELLAKRENFPPAYLVALLSVACATDILDLSHEFTHGQAQLELERTQICEFLLQIDPDHAETYKHEIAYFSRARASREMIAQLDVSRVHVDIDGIVDSLGPAFELRYERFQRYSELSNLLRTFSFPADSKEEVTTLPKGVLDELRELYKLTYYQDAGYRQAWNLFEELLLRFISSNEYGLDSYLSVRLRHGVISGHLRSPFEKHRLITTRSANNEYEENRFWYGSVKNSIGEEAARTAITALGQLSREADVSIEQFWRTRIHVKNRAEDAGLFDFVFSVEKHAQVIWESSKQAKDYAEYLNAMFSVLVDRTNDSLVDVVEHIRHELSGELLTSIEQTKSALIAADPRLEHTDLMTALKQCGIEVHNSLEVLTNWFLPGGGTTMVTLDLDILCATVIDAARRMYPQTVLNVTHQPSGISDVRGGTLSSWFDLMLILFDNAVRHSRLETAHVELAIDVENGKLNVRMRNDFAGDIEAARLAASRLSAPSFEWKASALIRQEGGSGFYKLHKIIRIDMRRGIDYEIQATVEEKNGSNWFSICISFSTQGLLK